MLNLNTSNYDVYTLIILSVIFSFVIMNFISAFLEKKEHTILLTGFMWTIYIIVNCIVIACFDSLVRLISLLGIMLLFAMILYKNDIRKNFFVTICSLFVELSCKTMVNFLFIQAFGYTFGHDSGFAYLFSLLLMLLLSFWAKHRRVFLRDDKISMKVMLLFSIVPFISMLIINHVFLLNIDNDHMNYLYSMITVILFLILNFVVFKIFNVLCDDAKQHEQVLLYREQLKLYGEYNEEREASLKTLRTLKHDLTNYLVTLKVIIEKGDAQESEAYLCDLIAISSNADANIKCGNIVIDTMLNHKENIAKGFGITCSYELEVPVYLPFADGDLCILLANALDNAITANQHEQIEHKYIHVFIKFVQQNLLIQISNPYEGNIIYATDGTLKTMKADQSSHGLGMDSMKQVLNKYDGKLEFTSDNKVFTLQVLLFQKP